MITVLRDVNPIGWNAALNQNLKAFVLLVS